jgi:hypothetical protein
VRVTPHHGAASRRLALFTWLALAGAAGLAVIAFWNTIHYGLAQDPFIWIGRTRGFIPHTTGIWRTLSYDLYYRVMDGAFGLQPLPYRIVGLALHGASAACVAAIAMRLGLSAGPSFLAAAFFATHYASFDALFAIGSISEPLATLFVLLSLWLALPSGDRAVSGARAILVVAAFAAAILSKETVVLYPLVLWLATRLEPRAARASVIPCAVVSAVFLFVFFLTDPVGSLRSTAGSNPYQAHWDRSMLSSWATYLSWAGHLVNLYSTDLDDRVGPHLEGWVATAVWIAALELLIARVRRSRAVDAPLRAGAIGTATYAAFIAPVLPLAGHAFHFYLYLPLAGLGWMLAASWEALVPAPARWGAWVAGLVLALLGFTTIRMIEELPLRETGLPFMGSVRRALTAQRLLNALNDPSAPLPSHLVLLGPDALSPPAGRDTTQLGAFLFNDVVGAAGQGDGIRLAFPHVKKVDFFSDLASGLDEPDVGVFDDRGGVLRGPTGWLWLRRAQVEWTRGRIPEAVAAMREAFRMTERWRSTVQGRWRDEGLRGTRMQTEAMLRAERDARWPAGDPRLAARPGYLGAIGQVAELTR